MNDSQVVALIAAVLLAGKYNDNANDAVGDAIELIAIARLREDKMAHARINYMNQQAAQSDE